MIFYFTKIDYLRPVKLYKLDVIENSEILTGEPHSMQQRSKYLYAIPLETISVHQNIL